MEKRSQGRVFLLLLLASVLMLLFLSTSSPLYPTNPWVDANCYVTVARGMRAGMVPYRDLIEQKGPLMYGLHYLAALVSPNGFFGVYLLETLACALFLTASYKTVRLYEKRGPAVPLLIGMAALLLSSLAFVYGDSAEELCAPLLAFSLYDALRYFRDGQRRMSSVCLLRNGLLAGCVLWIKYSLLGLHFAWMAVIAIESVARERRIRPALRMCLVFLSGMALSALPWLIYFGANGALSDLVQVYFVKNMTQYRAESNLLFSLAKGVGGGAVQNPLVFLLIVLGVVFVLRQDKSARMQKVCVAAMLLCTSLLAYYAGRIYRYSFYIYAAFMPLGVVPLLKLLNRREPSAGRRRLFSCGAMALCGCVALACCPMLGKIAYPRDALVQTRFAQEIQRTQNPTLLNYGFLDGGFYLAADVQPNQKWFVALNAAQDEGRAAQSAAVEAGAADYVVTKGRTLESYGVDASRYELILEVRDEYSKPRDQEIHCLYRRKDAEQETNVDSNLEH